MRAGVEIAQVIAVGCAFGLGVQARALVLRKRPVEIVEEQGGYRVFAPQDGVADFAPQVRPRAAAWFECRGGQLSRSQAGATRQAAMWRSLRRV